MDVSADFLKIFDELAEANGMGQDIVWQSISFKKGELIGREGDVFRRMYIIRSGMVRSYLIDTNGRDFTWHIHYFGDDATIKNLFVVDYASFSRQEPSKLFFEAIEDTELVYIEFEALEKLYASSPEWQTFGKRMVDEGYYYVHHRTLSLLSETAEVRYERLLNEQPTLLQRVPQYYIASYLGITPQSLSRIRKKLGA